MKLVIEILDIDGSLDRGNLSYDLRTMFNWICNKVEDNFKGETMDTRYLYDVNGNKSGFFQIIEE